MYVIFRTMNTIHTFALRVSKWPVWAFFFIAFVVFVGYVMPGARERGEAACGKAVIPDVEVGYGPARLTEILAGMDAGCREAYRSGAFGEDAVFPLVYGLFFFLCIVPLYYKGRSPLEFRGLYLLPLSGILADYGENFTLARLMLKPGYDGPLLYVAVAFSGLKWLFFYASSLLILFGLLRRLVLRFR